ncbi:MAG TPA: 16S rRNA (guanine(527)-N(7))-methyltransferase RsmG [Candidatus Coprenecus pullistercoris]|nr:16S rRNA (guanine(527)-N(7))-methyltransferase RsmG [Candidatus Coprenecus pullistercoris]
MNEELILKYFPETDSVQRERLAMLGPLYREWNERINVISRKDMDNLYLHHVLHSLALVRYIRTAGLSPASIFDAGCGGGFPGIPMAVLMPECRFTLCDSIAKKIKVVTEVSSALGLDNVEPLCSRTEAVKGRKSDYVVSRAVTELSKFIPLTRHLYTKGILYLKGGDLREEIDGCVRKCGIPPESISVSDISDFFEEEFFESKKIICIFKQKH